MTILALTFTNEHFTFSKVLLALVSALVFVIFYVEVGIGTKV